MLPGMTIVRVMFIGQGPSGLAEDRVVNTFHFAGAGVWGETDSEACMAAVGLFYTSAGTGSAASSRPLSEWLSPWVARIAELRSYNMADAKPRVPIVSSLTLGAAGSTSGLPEEIAVCATLHGAPPNTGRRRGRIYFGPLTQTANNQATATDSSHPQGALMSDLKFACQRLCESMHASLPWCIHSTKPTDNYVAIESGYVDNAFDIQRRRGPDPTTRDLWTRTV
jgi:hypothetical protein